MNKEDFPHYYKNVKNLEYIDVYRILELFNVTDQAIGHAIKKLLVAGGRGHQDFEKDVKEAIVSLERWLNMKQEDEIESKIENEIEHEIEDEYNTVSEFVEINKRRTK